jgi:asparagine synthase (glutamine-hydrolysing)
MCGIAGAVSLHPAARQQDEVVYEMSRCIAHRGPDGSGLWTSPSKRAVLAHRRLAIIDLATGDQPQVSPDGQVALVFNGEIYNYKELRVELERDGCVFRTQSDTEVLLQLIVREGDACVSRLRGMFAFAAWDERRQQLFLARDRVGKKPLFWAVKDGVCFFASTLEAVRRSLGASCVLDLAALDDYLTLGWIPAPRTIYEGIRKLEPSTVMTFDADGCRKRVYWDLSADHDRFRGSIDDAADALLPILREATRIRLRADVPLGVFLSGGIDSSLVTALAVQEDPSLRAFSVRFDDPRADESGHAERIAHHLGARHYVIDALSTSTDRLPALVRQFGEPFADSSAIPTSLLAMHARKHVTVALGGDGGDEGFAGYAWYRTFHRVSRLGALIPSGLASAVSDAIAPSRPRGIFAGHRGRVSRGLRVLGRRPDGLRYAALRAMFGPDETRELYTGALLERRRTTTIDPSGMVSLFQHCHGSALRRMRWVDIRTYLADDLNPKVDVATMAAGLEVRAPLLDQEVVRFGLSLPDNLLLDKRGGKLVLRRLLSRYLPPSLYERPKQGFSPPVNLWLQGVLRPQLVGLPQSEALQSLGVLRPQGIQRLIDEHLSNVRDHSGRLYALLVLEIWLNSTDSARRVRVAN